MKILGLDLATNTGYAYNDANGNFHCGTWVLATDKELKAARAQRFNRRLDSRVTKLFHQVQLIQKIHAFNIIIFEDVEFSSYTLQCQLWASLRASIWLGAFLTNPIFEAVPVGTLKRFAANHGAATKEMMAAALIKSDSRFTPGPKPATATFNNQVIDDNAIDAVWLWKWAKHNLSRVKV